MRYSLEQAYAYKGDNQVRLHYRASPPPRGYASEPMSEGQWRLPRAVFAERRDGTGVAALSVLSLLLGELLG